MSISIFLSCFVLYSYITNSQLYFCSRFDLYFLFYAIILKRQAMYFSMSPGATTLVTLRMYIRHNQKQDFFGYISVVLTQEAHIKSQTWMHLAKILFSCVNKLLSYFWGVSQNFCFIFDSDKFSAFFRCFNFCISHLNPLKEEYTVLKNVKSYQFLIHFFAVYIVSHCIF